MRTTAFVPFWSKGKDSFLSDPPNADISILEGDQLRQIVAVLQDPALQGGNLTYTVKVLQGEMRARGADVRRRAQSAMGFARENQVRTGLRAGGGSHQRTRLWNQAQGLNLAFYSRLNARARARGQRREPRH